MAARPCIQSGAVISFPLPNYCREGHPGRMSLAGAGELWPKRREGPRGPDPPAARAGRKRTGLPSSRGRSGGPRKGERVLAAGGDKLRLAANERRGSRRLGS